MSGADEMRASGSAAGAAAPSAPQQALTFVLGDGHYGVEILRVQEIRGFSPVTRIPHAPPHVLGVLNLRGSIVPIVDLRMRFGLDSVAYGPVTVIIVVAVMSVAGRRDFGLVVDGVSDVIDIAAGAIRPAPELNGSRNTAYVRGLLPVGERMLILLDIDRLVGADLAMVAQSLAGDAPAGPSAANAA